MCRQRKYGRYHDRSGSKHYWSIADVVGRNFREKKTEKKKSPGEIYIKYI